MSDLSNQIEQGLEAEKEETSRLPKSQCHPSILLHPNIPKPMHGVNPRSILGQSWWDNERKEAEQRTRGHCLACGIHKSKARFRQWMEGHELYQINYTKGRMIYIKTVPLCHYCHNYIHSGRMFALLEQGKFNVSQYRAIINHGDRVLAQAKITKPPPEILDNSQVASWGDWRLVIDGVEYPPKYKTPAHWAAAFGRSPSRHLH